MKARKTKIKVIADLVSCGDSLLISDTIYESSNGRRGKKTPLGFFYKGTNPITFIRALFQITRVEPL